MLTSDKKKNLISYCRRGIRGQILQTHYRTLCSQFCGTVMETIRSSTGCISKIMSLRRPLAILIILSPLNGITEENKIFFATW